MKQFDQITNAIRHFSRHALSHTSYIRHHHDQDARGSLEATFFLAGFITHNLGLDETVFLQV